jgi:hypothetical protein
MFYLEVAILLSTGCAFWLWRDSLLAREAGVGAVRALCQSEGLQLLDETIALTAMRPARNAQGRMILSRTYAFEYSDSGENRRSGQVHLLGNRVEILSLESEVPDRTLH